MRAPTEGPLADWPRWMTVRHASFGELEILAGKPSWEALLFDQGCFYAGIYPHRAAEVAAKQQEARLKAVLLDWRGVEDEQGKPVPYSWEALQKACCWYPALLNELTDLAADAFRGMTVEDRGNLNGQLKPSSTVASVQKTDT